MNAGIGVLLFILAASLIYLGLPDKDLISPRFLRFNSALVLYPPIILIALAFSAAELTYAVFRTTP